VITVDGERLPLSALLAIADGEPVRLGELGRARAGAAHELALRIAGERMVYGRTTGVGANKDTAVGAAAGDEHARRLLHSHATSAGALRDGRRVRLTMAVRLNQLAAGGSGARPEILDGLAALLASGTLPPVREHGGVGTGDLGALATIALSLADVRWTADDALPFLSSNAATLADAALAAAALVDLTAGGIAVAATTFAAVDGQPEAFSTAVEQITPYAGVQEVCAAMRGLFGTAAAAARLQDPFALRCLPQVHGLALDTLARLADVVSDGAAAAAENPRFDVADAAVSHHGGFHAAYLASALDAALLAVAGAAGLSLRRVALLLDPALTGLAAFLADGTMGLEYAAGSARGDLRALAAPASLQSAVLSRGVEDDASFASLAARQALDARAPYAVVLGCELVAAVRAIRLRGLELPPAGWGEVVRSTGHQGRTSVELADRDLTADIEAAAAALPRLARLVSPSG
jgi:histidine ammonia-lyase